VKTGSPSILGIAEFIVPTGSFFQAQTHISFHIIEELSPKVRMIPLFMIKVVPIDRVIPKIDSTLAILGGIASNLNEHIKESWR